MTAVRYKIWAQIEVQYESGRYARQVVAREAQDGLWASSPMSEAVQAKRRATATHFQHDLGKLGAMTKVLVDLLGYESGDVGLSLGQDLDPAIRTVDEVGRLVGRVKTLLAEGKAIRDAEVGGLLDRQTAAVAEELGLGHLWS